MLKLNDRVKVGMMCVGQTNKDGVIKEWIVPAGLTGYVSGWSADNVWVDFDGVEDYILVAVNTVCKVRYPREVSVAERVVLGEVVE